MNVVDGDYRLERLRIRGLVMLVCDLPLVKASKMYVSKFGSE